MKRFHRTPYLLISAALHASVVLVMWIAIAGNRQEGSSLARHAGGGSAHVFVGELETSRQPVTRRRAVPVAAQAHGEPQTRAQAPADSGSSTPAGPDESSGAPSDAHGTMGSGHSPATQRYLADLIARIEQRKEYPLLARRLGQTGRIEVAFSILPDGRIVEARVTSPCPHERLNEAALKLVRDLGPLPPPPSDAGDWNLRIPIEYRIAP